MPGTPQPRRGRLGLALGLAFWLVAGGTLFGTLALARTNTNPGSPDSMNNLSTARNIADGRGFTSDLVVQFVNDQRLPGPERLRFPGVCYLLAGVFAVFGFSLSAQMIINALTVVAAAVALRAAARLLAPGARWAGDAMGILFLMSGAYELHSIWNNNFITLTAALMLALIGLDQTGRIRPRTTVMLGALIAAFGFSMKPTSILSTGIPLAALIVLDPRYGRTGGAKFRYGAAVLGLTAALTAPYWLVNLIEYGRPLNSILPGLMRAERYGGSGGFEVLPQGTWWTVRYGQPVTLGEIIALKGFWWTMQKNVEVFTAAVAGILGINVAVGLLAIAGMGVVSRRRWRLYVPVALVIVEPVFSAGVYNFNDETGRYLWPAYPAILAILAMMLHDLRGRLPGLPPRARRFAVRAAATGLGLALLVGTIAVAGRWSAWFIPRATTGEPRDPPWAARILKEVPPGAVLLTTDPWRASFYTRLPCVMAPTGSRGDLRTVIERFGAGYYLALPYAMRYPVPFSPGDLRLIVRGRGWELWELTDPPPAAAP